MPSSQKPDFPQALAAASLADMHVAHDRSRFRFVFFGKTSSTYDTIQSWQYGTKGEQEISGDGSGVDPQDLSAQLEVLFASAGLCQPLIDEIEEAPDDLGWLFARFAIAVIPVVPLCPTQGSGVWPVPWRAYADGRILARIDL